MPVPNQKQISITFKQPCDKTHLYAKINLYALSCAMQDLKTQSAIKVWLYFAKNQRFYNFWLSSSDGAQQCGLSVNAFQFGVRILIKHGYLVQNPDNRVLYNFHELSVPNEEKLRKELEEEERQKEEEAKKHFKF